MRRIAAVLILAASVLAATPRVPRKLAIEPANPLLFGQGSRQALVVIAHHTDGSEEDVTARSRFTSAKPDVAKVDDKGLVTAQASGGAAILASYMGLRAETTALIQRAEAPVPSNFNG